MLQKLEEDFEKQKANHEVIMRRLDKEKAHWFPINNERNTANTIIAYLKALTSSQFSYYLNLRALLRNCILPRALHSLADAIFCARFVLVLHKLDTPNFSTLQYFNSVLSQVCITNQKTTQAYFRVS